MNEEKCYFEIAGRRKSCSALIKKECDGCAFYKTQFEQMESVRRSAEILKKKGLEAYQKGKIVTTRPIRAKRNNIFLCDKYESVEEVTEE